MSGTQYRDMNSDTRAYALSTESALSDLMNVEPLLCVHARLAFETGELLGEGGMGAVYRIFDKRLERCAALKIMNNPEATADMKERFLREARLTARLDHPAIPPVYEAGKTVEGQLYLLMRVIEGETLDDRIARLFQQGTPELKDRHELLHMLLKVCEAVSYAHSQGIVHRDLKPENIMLGRFGEVMVMDWGIALDLADARSDFKAHKSESLKPESFKDLGAAESDQDTARALTRAGTFVGTPGYVAPEQIAGEQADARADVFALGAILVECLTGERAIKGADYRSKLMATQAGEMNFPRDLVQTDRELDWIARQALKVNKNERTLTADQLTKQLTQYLSGARIDGYHYGVFETFERELKHHSLRWFAGLVSLVLVIGAASLWLSLESERKQALARASAAEGVLESVNVLRDLVARGAPEAQIRPQIERILSLGSRQEAVLYEAASLAQRGGLEQRARSLLSECVERYPPAYRAYFQLHLLELGDDAFRWTEWLTKLRDEARRRSEDNEFTLFAKGLKLQNAGRFKEALEAYNAVEDYSSQLPWMYNNRGVLKQQMGKLKSAIKDFGRCLEIEPRHPHAYFGRGTVRYSLGSKVAALNDFNRALELQPRYANAYSMRALVRRDFKDIDGALGDFAQALRYNPKDTDAYNNRGCLFKDLKRYDEAREDFDKAIEIDSKYAKSYANRGNLRELLQEHEGALEDFTTAIQCGLKNALIFRIRGQLKLKMRDFEGAGLDFERALEADPKDIHSWYRQGQLHQAQRAYKKALESYQRVLELDPRDLDAIVQRAVIFGQQKRTEEALAEYDRALKIRSDLGVIYFQRSRLYWLSGQLAKAKRDAQRFLKLEPKHPAAPQMRRWLSAQR